MKVGAVAGGGLARDAPRHTVGSQRPAGGSVAQVVVGCMATVHGRRLANVRAHLGPQPSHSVQAPLAAAAGESGPLSRREVAQWHDDGYVVLKHAVPAWCADSVASDIWKLAQRSPDDTCSWYRPLPPFATRSGTRTPFDVRTWGSSPARGQADLEVHMLSLWQQQSVWAVRQQPRIHAAFAQLWGTEKLWVSVDCANLKPPLSYTNPGWGGHTYLHWDWNLAAAGTGMQGVLYLADTGAPCSPPLSTTAPCSCRC